MQLDIRPVALDWEHPREPGARDDGTPWYTELQSQADLHAAMLGRRLYPGDYTSEPGVDLARYMPAAVTAGHGWQVYERTTLGTPASPVLASLPDLARWRSSRAAGWFRLSRRDARLFSVVSTWLGPDRVAERVQFEPFQGGCRAYRIMRGLGELIAEVRF